MPEESFIIRLKIRALEKEKLLKLETDEGGNMLVHIL